MNNKSGLAYAYDLYIAPVWRERFDQLFIDCLGLPTDGRILILQCGTGGLAIEIANGVKESGSVIATDTNSDLLELANTKIGITNLDNIRFISSQEIQQELIPNVYSLALGDASLLSTVSLKSMIGDLLPLISSEGKICLYTLARGSFDEFFSVFWEALYECKLAEQLHSKLESLLYKYPTVDEIEELSVLSGLYNIQIFSKKEEFTFSNGEEFISSPLVENYWLKPWLEIVPKERVKEVKEVLKRIIDSSLDGHSFEVGVKAILLSGNKKKSRATPKKIIIP